MKSFKKVLGATLIGASFLTAQVSSGAVALVMSNKTNAINGGVITGVGAAIGGVGYMVATAPGGAFAGVAFSLVGGGIMIAGGVAAAVGLVVLDDGGEAKIQYRPLSQEEAITLGLQNEVDAFNNEYELINGLQDQISKAADSIPNFDEKIAGEMWMDGLTKLQISKEAQKAMVTITVNALQAKK